MPERRRVSLNGTLYDIVGDVQRFLASTPPQKVVLGDYGEENHPLTSTISWTGFRKGMLTNVADLPEDIERSHFTTLNMQHKGHMFPQHVGGNVTKVTSSTSPL